MVRELGILIAQVWCRGLKVVKSCSQEGTSYSLVQTVPQWDVKEVTVLCSRKWKYSMTQLRSVTCHIGSHSVTCYLTQVNTPRLNPSHTGWYSIYLPRRDGRLSWPSWLDSAPAGSQTSNLSITSPTLNHCTTKTTIYVRIVSIYVSISHNTRCHRQTDDIIRSIDGHTVCQLVSSRTINN